jgi:hypothetical protein
MHLAYRGLLFEFMLKQKHTRGSIDRMEKVSNVTQMVSVKNGLNRLLIVSICLPTQPPSREKSTCIVSCWDLYPS